MKMILLLVGLFMLNGCAGSYLPNLTRAAIKKERENLPKNSIVMAEIEKENEELRIIEEEKKLEQKKISSTPQGTSRSVDLSWTILPNDYNGDEVFEELFAKFRQIGIKDKYESQHDFVSRTEPLIGDTIYAFSIPSTVTYKADNQKFIVNFKTLDNLWKGALGLTETINIREDDKSGGDYLGTNSFGVQVNVFVRYLTNYVLNCTPPIKIKEISIDMSSDKARTFGEDNIGLLFILKIPKSIPVNEIANISKKEREPTIDISIHDFTTTYLLAADIYQIWAYDKRSGKVLTKQYVHD